MTFSKAIAGLGAIVVSAGAAGSALAHTSLAPHSHPHPHGTSLLLGDEMLLIAMVAAAAIAGGLALVVGRTRPEKVRSDRRPS